MEEHATTRIETPIGTLRLAASELGLSHLRLPNAADERSADAPAPGSRSRAHLDAATRALDEYFGGSRKEFSDLALEPSGTPFQIRVWRALLDIPFGVTESYGELAARIGRPGASRAVGMANNRNPIALIIPCHRVIGANGQLTGYGGGLPTKRWLLAHEGAIADPLFQAASAG